MLRSPVLTHQLTVLVGLLLLIHQSAGTPVVTAREDPCTAAVGAPGPAPVFEYPRPDRSLPYEADYLFKVHPVQGATAYLWEFEQDGAVRDEVYRKESDSRAHSLGDLVHGYLRYMGFLWEANHEERSGVPVGVDGQEPVTAHAILRGSEEHTRFSPGELNVDVRADVCGVWGEAASLTVHLEPRETEQRRAEPDTRYHLS